MDIRITNTCNNDCMYCLEQSLRNKEKYISFEQIRVSISDVKSDILTFYGGNPLLHPELLQIIQYASSIWYRSISLLSNTQGITPRFACELRDAWLTGLAFYFNNFHTESHSIITWWWIQLSELISNIEVLQSFQFFTKCVIPVNRLNIDTLPLSIITLYKRYGISTFEFINYFPFDRPYNSFHRILSYSAFEKRKQIDILFRVIRSLPISVRFSKFTKDFFGDSIQYYDFHEWIQKQIGPEDKKRLDIPNGDIPTCFHKDRCPFCFIKEVCSYYQINNNSTL